jgi:hypothetical protein
MSEQPNPGNDESGEKLLAGKPETGPENSKDPENPESKPVEEREQWTDPVQVKMLYNFLRS